MKPLRTPKYQPPALHKLGPELSAFSRHLLEIRATLPSPGYHIDLDRAKAAATTSFLEEIPHEAACLREKILRYREAKKEEAFQPSLHMLELLCNDPLLIFKIAPWDLQKQLDASDQHCAAVIQASREEMMERQGLDEA